MSGPRVTSGKNAAQLINQTSGKVEYGTPLIILTAAWEVIGTVDLDPASSLAWNKRVNASRYYDKSMNGLKLPWRGNIWLNHPFHKGEDLCPVNRDKCKKKSCRDRGYHIDDVIPSNADWMQKLLAEYQCGNLKQSLNITFAATSEGWFKGILQHPQCFLDGRTNYVLEDGSTLEGVTKGSVVTYLGPNIERFATVFGRMGTVKIKYSQA